MPKKSTAPKRLILCKDGEEIFPVFVECEPYEDFNLFLHRNPDGGWKVSDGMTGRLVKIFEEKFEAKRFAKNPTPDFVDKRKTQEYADMVEEYRELTKGIRED